MTFREAYEALCDFRKGKMVYDDTLDEAIRIYMDKVDALVAENTALAVDLERTRRNLRRTRSLKEKYYKELKEVTKLWQGRSKHDT